MLDSDFWHEYAEKFRALDPSGQYLWASWLSTLESDGHARPRVWTLMGVGDLGHRIQVAFAPEARRAGRKLEKIGDLLDTWLNAVSANRPASTPGSGFQTGTDGNRIEYISGKILCLCVASSELCSELESRALEAEGIESVKRDQENDPRNWSALRQHFEAAQAVKSVLTSKPLEITEAFVRDAVARHEGIKPEDVTLERIRFEVTGMLPYYPSIKLITSQQSSGSRTDERWAVCPEAEKVDDERSPKLFDSEAAANRFLNSLVRWQKARLALRKQALEDLRSGKITRLQFPQNLVRKKNRQDGWQNKSLPVRCPERSSANQAARSFQDFLPPDEITDAPEQNLDTMLAKVLTDSFPASQSFLGEEWMFSSIEADANKRSGHQFEGRRNQRGMSEIISRAIYDFRASLDYLLPGLSARSMADFHVSWQLWRHLAQFCKHLGQTEIARIICGDAFKASRMAGIARDVLYGQLLSYAHEIQSIPVVATKSPEEQRRQFIDFGLEDEIGREARKKAAIETRVREFTSPTPTLKETQAPVAGRRQLYDAYFASFQEKVYVMDFCWAANQRYRELSRWLKDNHEIKDGSKPDKAFRAVMISGKRPDDYRAGPRPKNWK